MNTAPLRIADKRPPCDPPPAPERLPASDTRAREHGGPHTAPHLTEKQLALLWRGRRFPEGALVTRAGVPMRVIFQGRAGRGAGPDFRGAAIAGPSGLTIRGDVELHVRSSDFRAHGHQTDTAYANVILHVVFEDDTGQDTPLPSGGSAPVVALGPWVARRADELQRWLERPLLWREPCHGAVRRSGAEGVGGALDAEGDRRFEAKVALARDTVRADGLDQALYEGLLEALGYGGNAAPMRALARLLPWSRLHECSSGDRIRMEGLLLAAGGLLPSQRAHNGAIDPYVERLERVSPRARSPALEPAVWKHWGVRPENAAARRLAAAAALLERAKAPAALLASATAATVSEAVAPLVVAADGYWRTHHDVCANACRLPLALVGRARALEILINVVLPVACCGDDDVLAGRARALFARLPRPAVYGATKFIEAALASEGVRVPINARRAQGLLELQRNWCTQGGCGRCGLSESVSRSVSLMTRLTD